MARLFTSLFLVWALLLVPALCVGGLIEHPCGCGGESDIECQDEDTCQDEDSCTGDPCDTIVRTNDQEGQRNLELASQQVLVAVLTLDAEPASVRWSWSSRPPLPPSRWNLPYPQSDRPQLI